MVAEEFVSALQFLLAIWEAAPQAGVWRYADARRGRQLGVTDCLIAAIAHERGIAVVTGNVADFPMPGVTVRPLPRERSRPD